MYTYIYIYIYAAVVSFQVGWASPPLAPHCFPWPLCLAKVNMHVCALRLCEQPEQSGDGQRGDEQPEQSGDEQPEPHQSGDGQWQQPEQWW